MEETTLSVATFVDGLKGLLDLLCARPGRWILIAEDAERPYLFLQALAFEDGSLVSEVVSNYYLADDKQWSADEEDQLIKQGWESPAPPRRTNWINVESTTSPPTGLVACRAFATLRFVFGIGLEDKLTVRMFSSPIRGDTPASSLCSSESDAELIDLIGGPDEEDPDLHPDPSADDPPFGDEPVDDDDDTPSRLSSSEKTTILVRKEPPTSTRVYMRPPTDVGPDGLTDEQVEEMAEDFIRELIDEHSHASLQPTLILVYQLP